MKRLTMLLIGLILVLTACTQSGTPEPDPALAQKDQEIADLQSEVTLLKAETEHLNGLYEFFSHSAYPVYDIDTPLRVGPSSGSELIKSSPTRVFILSSEINEAGETWHYVEGVFPCGGAIRYGFIQTDLTALTPLEFPVEADTSVQFGAFHVGDPAGKLMQLDPQAISPDKGELSWGFILGEAYIAINPVSWQIKAVYSRDPGMLFDGRFAAGDNAAEAIDYYTDKFPIFYSPKTMMEEPDNIFDLGDSGLILIIVYDTENLTPDSLIEEIKIFSRYDIN